MTPEREAVARTLYMGSDPDKCVRWHNENGEWTCIKHAWETELPRADGIIAEHIAPLRTEAADLLAHLEVVQSRWGELLERLAAAERERDEARGQADFHKGYAERQAQYQNADKERAASLEGLLTEARENQSASQRMTASVERSLDRSIALHEAAEALLAETVPELGEMAAAAAAFPRYADSARVTVAMGACRRARALLTRIEAREGGEEKGRG